MKNNQSKIVFIISTGHSGSTLLDLLLGTLPGTFSTGELVWLPWQVWRDGKMCTATPKQDICTCLNTFKKCPVWNSVLSHLSSRVGYEIPSEPFRFNISFLRQSQYTAKLPLTTKVTRRMLQHAVVTGKSKLADRILGTQSEVINNTLLLYESISSVLEDCVIIDSSKDILRAYALWKKIPDHVKVILLYKDAKSYAASRKHWGKDIPIEKYLKKWLTAYEKSYVPILKKMSTETLILKYDEMTEEPTKTRRILANFIGSEVNEDDWAINTRNMHLVAGNPMRFKGLVKIKYDDRWRRELTEIEKQITSVFERRMSKVMACIV